MKARTPLILGCANALTILGDGRSSGRRTKRGGRAAMRTYHPHLLGAKASTTGRKKAARRKAA